MTALKGYCLQLLMLENISIKQQIAMRTYMSELILVDQRLRMEWRNCLRYRR